MNIILLSIVIFGIDRNRSIGFGKMVNKHLDQFLCPNEFYSDGIMALGLWANELELNAHL